MLKKKEVIASQDMTTGTVLAEGITIKNGNMTGDGDVKIGGIFIGDIDITGVVIISESGNTKGTVQAKDAVVEGVVEGNVEVNDLIHITPTGKIYGDLKCHSLIIDSGASFTGSCEMGEKLKQYGNSVVVEKEPAEVRDIAESSERREARFARDKREYREARK